MPSSPRLMKRLAHGYEVGKETDEKLLQEIRKNPYKMLNLEDAVGVRPSAITYKMSIRDDVILTIARQVYSSSKSSQRLGKEWRPFNESTIKRKTVEDEGWVSREQLASLDDVCTKWCSKTFFPDAFSRLNMISNVLRLYNRVRDVTGIPFDIIFKGGVMIRIIILEFLQELPLVEREKLRVYMDSFNATSLSDFDFEIVARNKQPRSEDIHRMIILNFAILLWLQSQMEAEMEDTSRMRNENRLLITSWDSDVEQQNLRKHLQMAVDKLGPSHPLFGATIDAVSLSGRGLAAMKMHKTKSGRMHPEMRRNLSIFDCDSDKCVLSAQDLFKELGMPGDVGKCTGTHFYSTLNWYIGEGGTSKRAGHLPGLFHLSRIKHSFVLYYTTRDKERRCDRLSGEMIDLSQSNGVKLDHLRHWLYSQNPHPYYEYPILGVNPQFVKLRSYTPYGFYLDHVAMIHHTDVDPWSANKLHKRMLRCVVFLVVHVLSPHTEGTILAKVGALQKLVSALRDVESLRKPLKTGITEVDEFANRERVAVLSTTGPKAKAYLNKLHKHMNVIVSTLTCASKENSNTLHLASLKNMNRFLLST